MKSYEYICRFIVILIASGVTVCTLASCKADRAVTLSDICEKESKEEYTEPVIRENAFPSVSEETEGTLCVYVCGKVVSPGVYELGTGSRVKDALEAAGGFDEGADEVRINLAEKVFDGQMIYFPSPGEDIPSETLPDEDTGSLININSASASALMNLPGIGEAKAKAIVKYREENGAFKNIDDIKKVPGIGDSLFSGICDLIRV